MKKLGKFLVEENIISSAQLDNALMLSKNNAVNLKDILISEEMLTPYQFYSSLAKFENLQLVDLIKNPCDKKLASPDELESYIKLKFIPWQKENGLTVIATSCINKKITRWAKEKYGTGYRFIISTPFDIDHNINAIFEKENNNDAIDKLYKLDPLCSAKNLLKGPQSKLFLFFLIAVALYISVFPHQSFIYLLLITISFYIATLSFKTILFIIGTIRFRNSFKNEPELAKINYLQNSQLPVYTILIPLYKEEKVLPKLVEAIRKIDYPKSKLDVKLIVETDDELTINAIKKLECESIFDVIKVPYSMPRTKPKACNYALRFAKGEYVTIYDAEDIPGPLQLKKVIHTFKTSEKSVACIQARLNYFNRNENYLTKLFAIEYSNLFDFVLFGLEELKIPIPLGGTSNHFKTEILRKLYGWDPFNVTEDADLGIRLYQKGLKAKVINSITMEEAPISLVSWIKQRSRWIKGHMQTYLVHMRRPRKLFSQTGLTGFMGIQLFLGAPTLIFLISPFMWLIWLLIVTGIFEIPPDIKPGWFDDLIFASYFILIIGAIMQVAYALTSVIINKWKGMYLYCMAYPFYWFLHSVASFKALWQLIFNPYYWEKTSHGITKVKTENC